MAITTQGAPGSIGTLAYPITQPYLGNCGPYSINAGGTTFFICTEVASDQTTQSIVAYTSTDGDSTLTRVASGIRVAASSDMCVFYDQLGGPSIYVGYCDPVDTFIKFVVFNMSLGAFGSPVSSGVSPNSTPLSIGTLWVANSGSNVWIAWDDNSGLNFLYYNGAWSSRVPIPSAGDQILPMTSASGGMVAVWSVDIAARGNNGSGSYFYTLLSGATIVSTSTALTLPDGDNRVENRFNYSGYYDAASDSSVLPLPMFLHSTFNDFHALLIASPSASPSFSLVTVASFNDVDFTGWPWLTGNAAGTSFALFWYRDRDSDGEDFIEFSTASSLNGTWSAAGLYYDQEATPPSPTPTFDGLFPLSANTLSTGDVIAVVGMTNTAITPPPRAWCGILYTWPFTACPDIFVSRQAQPAAPSSASPPVTCEEFAPTTGTVTYVAYDEPLELQGS